MQNAPPDSPRSGRSLGGSEVVKGSSASLVDPLSGSVVVPEAVLSNALPTLHEDAEFTCPSAAGASSSDVKALPLTLSALHLTEKKRALMNFEARPLPGSFCCCSFPWAALYSTISLGKVGAPLAKKGCWPARPLWAIRRKRSSVI